MKNMWRHGDVRESGDMLHAAEEHVAVAGLIKRAKPADKQTEALKGHRRQLSVR